MKKINQEQIELFGSNSLSCYSYSGRSKGVCGYTHGRNAISNHQDDDVAADEDQDDNDDNGDDHENVDNGKKSNLTGTQHKQIPNLKTNTKPINHRKTKSIYFL